MGMGKELLIEELVNNQWLHHWRKCMPIQGRLYLTMAPQGETWASQASPQTTKEYWRAKMYVSVVCMGYVYLFHENFNELVQWSCHIEKIAFIEIIS